MHEQPRRSNGQFGETLRDEAAVDLSAVPTPAVPQGSFLYPPIVHTAEEAVAFWENVEIPDEICMKASAWYVGDFQRVIDEGPEGLWIDGRGPAAWAYWEVQNPRPDESDPAAVAAWEAQKAAFGAEFVNGLRETLRSRPQHLDPRDVRQFVKTIGLVGSANTLSAAEAEKIRHGHYIELTTGTDTVWNTNLNNGLFGFGEALRNPGNFDPEQRLSRQTADIVVAVGRELDASGAALRDEFGNVNDNLVKVADVVIRTS